MKHKFKPSGSVIAGLDVGSSKIACLIGRVIDDAGGVEVLGVGYQASSGVKNGRIVDLQLAEKAIRATVHAAENMAAGSIKGYPLRDVIMNVPGTLALSHNVSADIRILGQAVTDMDVRRALAKAQDEIADQESELIHTIPAGYRIDGQSGVRQPCGMVGQTLDVGIHMVSAELGPLQNLASCIQRSHLDIEALCLDSYAAGLATLVEDEMDLGATLIDIGGGVTSIAVFQGGAMIYADAVPLGGWHITNDIAKGLVTPLSAAERLKTLYGNALMSGTDDSETIEVRQVGEDDRHAVNHVPRAVLVGIIQPRLEEIFELVRNRLDESGMGKMIGRRVVLAGGGSQMPGLRDLAQAVLDKQVRLGRPIRVSALPDAVSGPAFAAVSGLLTYGAARLDEMPADIMSAADMGSLWERARLWWKENW